MKNIELKHAVIKEPFEFYNKKSIAQLEISYETYGTLNEKKDNVILVCHFFSGDRHAAGYYSGDSIPGWWDGIIGPGKAFDTDKYFIISTDSLCGMVTSEKNLTSSPRNINPETNKPFSADFPIITIWDMVNAQKKLLDHLGITELYTVAGPSMGGLQTLAWARLYPEMVKRAVVVAAGPELDGFAINFPLRMGIQSILEDPDFCGGFYYEQGKNPLQGLFRAVHGLAVIARHREWTDDTVGGRKFSKDKNPLDSFENGYDSEMKVIQGVKDRAFCYDANCYLRISKANQLFRFYDLDESEKETFEKLQSKFLLIAESGDLFVPPKDVKAFHEKLLKNNISSTYCEFTSPVGHLGSVSHASLFSKELEDFLNQ